MNGCLNNSYAILLIVLKLLLANYRFVIFRLGSFVGVGISPIWVRLIVFNLNDVITI